MNTYLPRVLFFFCDSMGEVTRWCRLHV